jgi:signal transduction histidine kinase
MGWGRGLGWIMLAVGTGLTNMQDRLDALGGSLRIESAQHRGTQVSGTVPRSLTRVAP